MPEYTFHFRGHDPGPEFMSDDFDDDAKARLFARSLVAHFRKNYPDECEAAYLTVTNEQDELIATFLLSTVH